MAWNASKDYAQCHHSCGAAFSQTPKMILERHECSSHVGDGGGGKTFQPLLHAALRRDPETSMSPCFSSGHSLSTR